jgi:hypothetical protein
MTKETGGPAFPINVDSEMTCLGITARDYFAAKAMAAVMPEVIKELQKTYITKEKSDRLKKAACEACYGMADAMLEAREQ